MTSPCLDSLWTFLLQVSTGEINETQTPQKRGEMTFVYFQMVVLFLIAPDISAEMLKILEQNVQNVLELYFILGCQAHWVCITKHWNNKKQVPCQVSFIIGKLRVDVFCKKTLTKSSQGLHPALLPYIEWDTDRSGERGCSTPEHSRQQITVITLFVICGK